MVGVQPDWPGKLSTRVISWKLPERAGARSEELAVPFACTGVREFRTKRVRFPPTLRRIEKVTRQPGWAPSTDRATRAPEFTGAAGSWGA